MNQTPAKNQHYYPRVFLKGFCNESDNIYFYDSEKNKIESRNRKSVAREKHLYTVSNQKSSNKNYAVEEKFSEIENHASPLFERIRVGRFEGISDGEINQLIEFIVLTFVRTPIHVEVAEGVMLKKSFLAKIRNNSPSIAEDFIKDMQNNKGLAYALTLDKSFKQRHERITENFDGFLITLNDNAPSLLLNDTYTCLELIDSNVPYIERDEERDVDWASIKTKMHFPVSSRCCVSFIPKAEEVRKGTPRMVFHKATLSEKDASIINHLSYQQARRYAYCADQSVLEGLRDAK